MPSGAHLDLREAEFSAYFRETVAGVRRFASRMVGPDACDDIVSETFTTVWRRWDDVPVELSQRRAWTFRVAHFRVQHWYESETRHRNGFTALLPDGHVADHSTSVVGDDWTERVIATLPPAERAALALVVWHDMSATDAAYILDCTPSALSSRLLRARQRLNGQLSAAPEGWVS